MSDTGVELALSAAGGPTKLAAALGITQAAVSQWQRVPVSRVLEIERIYGVPRHQLRPDFYPAPHPEEGRQHDPHRVG